MIQQILVLDVRAYILLFLTHYAQPVSSRYEGGLKNYYIRANECVQNLIWYTLCVTVYTASILYKRNTHILAKRWLLVELGSCGCIVIVL